MKSRGHDDPGGRISRGVDQEMLGDSWQIGQLTEERVSGSPSVA